jgi:hypothetical protein
MSATLKERVPPCQPASATRRHPPLNPMADKPESAHSLLKGGVMAALRAELEVQGRMLQAVRRGLPDFLGSHCRHCVIKGDRLLIYVDSPAWGSQLRFHGPSLLLHLEQTTGRRFRDIQVRNLLPAAPTSTAEKPRAVPPPGPGVSELLRESAENAPHEDIREALLRLSRTLEKAREGKD